MSDENLDHVFLSKICVSAQSEPLKWKEANPMKLTYAFTREALKAEAFDGELKKKSGNIPAKREKETVAAVL